MYSLGSTTIPQDLSHSYERRAGIPATGGARFANAGTLSRLFGDSFEDLVGNFVAETPAAAATACDGTLIGFTTKRATMRIQSEHKGHTSRNAGDPILECGRGKQTAAGEMRPLELLPAAPPTRATSRAPRSRATVAAGLRTPGLDVSRGDFAYWARFPGSARAQCYCAVRSRLPLRGSSGFDREDDRTGFPIKLAREGKRR
jgi:hypothetical protein